jgi:Protein of unknown function (DUF1176)
MKINLKSVTLSLLLFGISQNVQAQSAPQAYRDWSVTCDNVRTCMAYSTSANSEGGLATRPRGLSEDVPEGWMTIERAAGPSSDVKILLSRPDLSTSRYPADMELRLLGPNGRVLPQGAFAATLGSRGTIEIAPSLSRQFLTAARGANHVILVVGPTKRPVFYVSLSGLVASGRAIDSRQGRTGTVNAMIDVGRRPATAVPAAPSVPTITAQAFKKKPFTRPPEALMQRRAAECDDAERLDAGGTNIESFDMGRGRVLWSVPCGAGAYNTWNRYYIAPPRGALMRASFLRQVAVEGADDINIVNANVTPANGTIKTFNKSRGLGDCGSSETYAWDGRDFVLAGSREMVPCGGIVSDFWPSTFTSRIVTTPAQR